MGIRLYELPKWVTMMLKRKDDDDDDEVEEDENLPDVVVTKLALNPILDLI